MTYNKKSLGPVIMFVFWSVLLALVCLVGITGVFAAEYTFSYNDTQTYYDNLGSSVTYVNSSWNESLQAYVSDNINTTANSYGAGVSINAPIPILENHTYTLTLAFPDLSNITLSSKNHIGLSISALGAANNYAANNYYAEMQYSTNQSNKILQFVFKATGNASYIFIPFTTTYTTTQSYFLNKIIIEDLGSEGVSQDQINISLGNQTVQIQDSLTNTENNIKNEISNTEDNIKNELKNTEDNIKDGIKEGFESCRDSYNLFSLPYYSAVTSTKSHGVTFIVNNDGSITISGQNDGTGKSIFYLSKNFVLSSGDYKFTSPTNNLFLTFYFDKKYVSNGSFSLTSDTTIVSAYLELGSGSNSYDNYTFYPMLNKGTILRSFETPGEKICSNRIDDTNKKLDEQNETSKGILGKIKDILSYINPFSENFFAYKLIELLIDGLKSLFIPSNDFFSNWWNDFKSFMDAKLGFLAKPIDIFITFISSYLNLSEDNIIINIPDITVPNFEDNILIHAQTFNWKELLQSKASFNNLWQLYLDFVDVFLIFNFIGLCEGVYARIFGGDTSNYEYYTVEDSYYFDSSTGEVSNAGKHSERTVTKRKKV